MSIPALHDELATLGGPVERPTAQDRDAVRRRVRRARAGRVVGAVGALVVIALVVLLVAAPWRSDGGDTRVVTSAGTTIRDERLGFSVTIPPRWKRIPQEVQPRDQLPLILRLESPDYVPGRIGADCATSVEQTGINIGLQEMNSRPIDSFTRRAERRPTSFGPDSSPFRTEPGSPLCHRLVLSTSFVDGDRRFYVAITMAPDTSSARQAEVYEILNSLRFDDHTIVEQVRPSDGVTTTTG
jgi:hypothetical protein